jgi:hypothetical protein
MSFLHPASTVTITETLADPESSSCGSSPMAATPELVLDLAVVNASMLPIVGGKAAN